MTRKLLPYEHDLIAALGISKEEYLEFIALQAIYNDPKQGTELDIRNDAATVAIVLTIVGILFQVGAALLAPKPQVPAMQTGGGQPQTRDERFSPRFGFNSVQELAAYGDPVNLVYANRGIGTNANPNGGVRVTSSLLWSAVRSYGSSQYIQMLLMLAGGAITALDYEKSAFGQTPLRDLMSENLWMYFNPGGTGALKHENEIYDKESTDPAYYGSASDNPYRVQPTSSDTRKDGFSQAYSPSTANTFGVYGVVPLNILLYLRNSSGNKQSTNLGVTASGISWTNATNPSVNISVDDVLTVSFASTKAADTDTDVQREAKDARRSLLSTFDNASTFKLGTALFRVTSISGTNIDEKDITIKLKCIEKGSAPRTTYASEEASSAKSGYTTDEEEEYKGLKSSVQSLLDTDERPTITTALELAESGELKKATYAKTKTYVQATEALEYKNYGGKINYPNGLKKGYYKEGTIAANTKYYKWTNKLKEYTKIRALTSDEDKKLRRFAELDAITNPQANDIFYTKALVRVAVASYETLSACHTVDFAAKAVVFKRISGRQSEYGSKRRKGYPASDNGIKPRVSMFKLRYREVGQDDWVTVPAIFAISRAADNDNFIYFKFNSGLTDNTKATNWAFELDPVSEPLAETAVNKTYYYISNAGDAVTESQASYTLLSKDTTTPSIQFIGEKKSASSGSFPPVNNNPKDLNEWDLFNYDSDTQIQFSFDNGPEISITAVTEQIQQAFSDYTVKKDDKVIAELYQNLALFGFNAYSGKSIQDLRSFSVFATEGRKVRRLRTEGKDDNDKDWGTDGYAYYPSNPDGASSLAPDIFLDTVLDSEDGIGKYAEVDGIDMKQLAITKRFCAKNKLFMDCVIASPRSWREFWVEVAPYSLLEFARIGGRETLVPAVPYDSSTGEITQSITITALFNQGNILEDSYKEEYIDYGSNVQDLIATLIYTDMPKNAVFAKKRTVDVQLKDTVEADAIKQTFDLSNYVASRDQAILYGKLLCNTRRHVRQAVEFKTYPTTDPVSPGAFIYVDIGQNSWDNIRTGVIGKDGLLNVPLGNTPSDGTYNFQLYRSDKGMQTKKDIQVTSGAASSLASFEGYLFVLGVQTSARRIFRVSEVTMDEEGETTVRATNYPCTTDEKSLLADFSDDLFVVRS